MVTLRWRHHNTDMARLCYREAGLDMGCTHKLYTCSAHCNTCCTICETIHIKLCNIAERFTVLPPSWCRYYIVGAQIPGYLGLNASIAIGIVGERQGLTGLCRQRLRHLCMCYTPLAKVGV